MNQKERMLAGLPYKAWLDGLSEERSANKSRIFHYNKTNPADRDSLYMQVQELLGGCGNEITIEPPFYCDYGRNITVGENFFANFNCTILDVAPVTIGKNVMFGPNVSLYTAGHPLHPESRNSGYEYGKPIVLGDNVWLGGNVIVNPGITIGNNVVVGAGSVVTKDIPDNYIAVGNPARLIRQVTEEDRPYFHRKEKFDVSDY